MNNADRYKDSIKESAIKYGFDPSIIAKIIQIETSWNLPSENKSKSIWDKITSILNKIKLVKVFK